jgi:hypothetical protein
MDKIATLVQKFNPITLEEMDRVKLMNRIDTKFAFSVNQLVELLPALSNDYRILEIKDTRTPHYQSLYFDDVDFSFFNAHHNGRTNRFKVRIRKYVESDLFFLELKHKIKGRTDKKRIKATDFSESLDEQQVTFLNQYLTKDAVLKANLWNSFNRITLVNNVDEERLTLDFNLHFHWEETHHKFENLVIAELKQSKLTRNSPFYQLMKTNYIRPYRLSKYCIGAIELYNEKNIKYNRFKEKLLKLKSINAHVA